MRFFLETTAWEDRTPNHIYLLDDSKTKMYGYIPRPTHELKLVKKPYPFSARGRQFREVPNYWNFQLPGDEKTSQVTRVKGSKGQEYLVERTNTGIRCTCPGFTFRGDCRHIKEV